MKKFSTKNENSSLVPVSPTKTFERYGQGTMVHHHLGKATTKDLKAYIFCVADATAYITNGHAEVTMAK